MKKLIPLLVAATLLAGCATNARQAVLQARHDATQSITKVELIYNEQDQLVVMDGGGSGFTGMAGLLGPVGLLVAAGVDAGSRGTMADRTDRRSKEFMAAMKNSGMTLSLNRQFAEQLAARLEGSGREVKLTPAKRATGKLSEMQVPDLQPTTGYNTLILRITTGYGAPDTTSSYTPVIVVEQLLKDEQQSVLYQTNHTPRVGEPTYFLYDGLLKDTAGAYEGLKQGLATTVQPAYLGMFGEDGARLVRAATAQAESSAK